jgi:cobalt-precorrin 5A hydrolase
MEIHPAMIAAGFGCRPSCSVADVCAALELALRTSRASLPEVRALFGAEVAAAPALREAASTLDKPLLLLPLAALKDNAAAALTRSARVLERFGLPSIAETAALAGLRELGASGARLLSPRVAYGAATCALATWVEAT